MTLWESLRMAVAALLAHKQRSAITMLGVIIGVAAVIATVAVGNGAQKDVLGSVSSMGSNLIYANPASDTPGGSPLTYDDAEAVSRLMGVAEAVPQAGGVSTVAFGGETASCYAFGTTPNYTSVNEAQIAVGRFFTQADVDRSARVVVLGLQNADDLGTRDLLGKKAMVGGSPSTEIGIRKALGARSSDILGQFLIESVALSLLGGMLGVVVGYGLVLAAQWVLNISGVIQPSVVLLAFAVSAAVGVFFGVYPAWKAGRQDPIEALRYQ